MEFLIFNRKGLARVIARGEIWFLMGEQRVLVEGHGTFDCCN